MLIYLDLDILLDEKTHEIISTYGIAHKTPYGAKSLCIIFGRVDGYIIEHDGSKYLALF